ncbi:MAG: SRPBCC family protein [Anaerolineales bacterium]
MLLTEACLRRLELPEAGWLVQPESYEGLGEIRGFVLDLHARYRELLELRRVVVADEDADLVMTYDLPAPPPAAWEWLNDPAKRSRWEGLHVYADGLLQGRSGPGMRTHCVHGKKEKNVHTVLDWRPFDYFTIEISGGGGTPKMAVNTVRLEAFDGGTRVTDLSRTLIRPRWLSRVILRRAFEPDMRRAIQRLRDLVSKEGKSTGEVASG